MIKIIHILVLCILLLLQLALKAQTKVQVVTRTIQKSFKYKPSCYLHINAEKARIIIKRSNSNTINLRLSQISKNTSVKDAENDLQYIYYQIDEKNNGIYISNFFNFKLGKNEIRSLLSVSIELEVPNGIRLNLKDTYGDVEISSLQGTIITNIEFGSIKFSNITGTIDINSNYSDIAGQGSDVQMNIVAQKADINLNGIFQPAIIKNQYGSVLMDNVNASLSIDAKMTSIELRVEDFINYSFDVTSQCGEIEVPKNYNKYILNYRNFNITCDKTDARYISSGKIPVNLKTTYNNIIIKQN